MKRIGVVLAAVVLLPGCGLPIGIQMASLAVQGMSLAATEKTPSDHVISLVAEKDCATWRALAGDPICSDLPAAAPDVMVAEAIEPAPSAELGPSSWALPAAAVEPSFAVAVAPLPDIANFATAAGPADPASAPAATLARDRSIAAKSSAPKPPVVRPPVPKLSEAIAAPAADSIYLVVASFDTNERAHQLAGRHASLKPQVVKGDAKGNTVYRVVVGPMAKTGQGAERRRLEAAGLKDAWALPFEAVQVVKASPVKPIQVAEAVIGR